MGIPRLTAVVAGTVLAVALIVALATYHGTRKHSARTNTATVLRGDLRVVRTIKLGGPITGLFVSPSRHAWASVADRNELVEVHANGAEQTFAGIPAPGPLVGGSAGLWVTLLGQHAAALVAGGRLGAPVALPARPLAIALDARGRSAWVTDAGGGVSRVGGATPLTTHISSPATGLAVGEPSWVWAADGDLVQISPSGRGTVSFNVGPGAVAVTLDQGVWTAHRDGAVTRFDPSPGHMRVVASIVTPAPLSGIAAREGSPFVWAISAQARSLYEIEAAHPAIIGIVRFSSPPTLVAVTHLGVWVATATGSLIRVRR